MQYHLPKVEVKDYSVMINGRNFLDQPVKNNLRTYENFQKITTGQGDDYTQVAYQIMCISRITIR